MKLPPNATHYGEQGPDPRPGFYYVSMVSESGRDFALLSGPYALHADALAHVDTARDLAYELNWRQAVFSSYGTCRLEQHAGGGLLNVEYLKIEEYQA